VDSSSGGGAIQPMKLYLIKLNYRVLKKAMQNKDLRGLLREYVLSRFSGMGLVSIFIANRRKKRAIRLDTYITVISGDCSLKLRLAQKSLNRLIIVSE
jgi:hypothetical protein